MHRSRSWLIAFVILAATIYFAGRMFMMETWKRSAVTAYGSGPGGMTVFYRLMSELQPESVQILGHGIFDRESLGESRTLAVLSPRRALTARESTIVSQFVADGGKLILSFHDEATRLCFYNLFRALDLLVEVNTDEAFKNGQTITVASEGEPPLFESTRSYHFYSSQEIQTDDCNSNSLGCYALLVPFGSGEVLVIAGLPPMANALIGRGDNRYFAFALINWAGRLTIDEYHHFFSDKTMWSLLRQPSFSIPLAAVVLGVLLFFFLAHTPFYEQTRREKRRRNVPSYHALNEEVLLGVLMQKKAYASALQLQMDYIERRFPEQNKLIKRAKATLNVDRHAVTSRKHFIRYAGQLIGLHQRLLQEKGKTLS